MNHAADRIGPDGSAGERVWHRRDARLSGHLDARPCTFKCTVLAGCAILWCVGVSILLTHGLIHDMLSHASSRMYVIILALLTGSLIMVVAASTFRAVRDSGEAADDAATRHRSLIESIPDAVWSADSQGRTTYVSPNGSRIHGYSLADLQQGRGGFWFTRIHPEDVERVRAAYAQAVTGGHLYDIEYRLRTKDDRTIWVRERACATHEEHGLRHVDGLLTDISRRKADENALRDSEERFRVSFDDAAVGMAIADLEGHILQSNETLRQMLGYDAAELRSKLRTNLIHPEDNGADHDLYQALLAGRRRTYQVEQRYIRKDGQVIWGRLGVSLVRDAGGTPQFSIGILSDITQRKQAEEALQASEEQLRHAQKMEAIGLLAGGVAHDFRNQLTVIKGYSEMLLRRDLVHAPAREYVQEILKAANRSAALTGELLSFGRKQILRPDVVNLNTLAGEMAKPLQAMLGEDVQLSISAAADLASVRIDPVQFQQALVNLVVNARDAMPGGGQLRIETANVMLDAAFVRRHAGACEGSHVMAAISDTGSGMDEQTLARVFEPFFTTKPVGQGTGLGLAMVYGFVRQSGGYLDVTSQPGCGTTFRLYFPRCTATAADRAMRETPAAALPPGTGVVLVVEDEESIRRLIVQNLQECGYQVLQACDAQQAIALANRHAGPLDLLVTDVVLPGASGPDLVRQMRASRPPLPVLYISGYMGQALTVRGIDNEEADLLIKPFDSQAIVKAVRRILAGPVPVA